MNFTKTAIFFLFIIFTFSIPVNASDVIENGDFYYNYSGWTYASSTNYWSPTYSLTWNELNATTHDGYISFYSYTGHEPYWIKMSLTQTINTTGVDMIYVKGRSSTHYAQSGTFKVTVGALVSDRFPTNDSWNVQGLNISSLSGMQSLKIEHTTNSHLDYYGSAYFVDWVRTDEYTEDVEFSLNFTQSEFLEYETAYIDYDLGSFLTTYPDDTFELSLFTPQSSYYPYFYGEFYNLTEQSGTRSLQIGAKSPLAPEHHQCKAWITRYNESGYYQGQSQTVYANVTTYNHTLLKYSNYDYPTNQSYVTGQYISVLSDIEEYIETDYLGYPDELFTLWIYAYSNSNEGNVYISHDLNSVLWSGSSPYNYQFEYQPYINNDFNATIESYISVYRNGNTTKLTPTIYTNMYADGYIPQNETGYIPPDPEIPPVDPEIPDPEIPPDNPEDDPEIPEYPTGTNTSINVSWMDGYYDGLNNTCDTLLSPVYNFTNYTLSPIYKLNNSISEFNCEMNISFNETNQKMQLLTGSFNIVFNSFHPKIVNVITYYLMWLILLIILKKR